MTTTRFAPSPTGHLHVGNLRTALFNFLLALQTGGNFILRLDDTDPERCRQEYEDSIQSDLEWLGLNWHRRKRQSERLDRYREAASQLRTSGFIYECFETQAELALRRKTLLNLGKPPIYDRAALKLTAERKSEIRLGTPGYWRFLLNGERTKWVDGIQGEVSIDTASLSDPVLIRADGQFLYTMASVVDDIDMEITHVVRGSDHITNTAVQVQIMRSFGERQTNFAHHSLLTGPKGEPLAKRLGDLAIRDLRANGVEPMVLLSYLAFSGSNQPVKLCKSLEELAENFELGSFSTSPVKFDERDLEGMTSRFLAGLSFEDVRGQIRDLGVPNDLAECFWNAVKMNLDSRDDLKEWWLILQNGAKPLVEEKDKEFVQMALELLPQPPFDGQTWANWTQEVRANSERKGRSLFMPLRRALTGKSRGPEMQSILPLMQKVSRDF